MMMSGRFEGKGGIWVSLKADVLLVPFISYALRLEYALKLCPKIRVCPKVMPYHYGR